jgi:hypothetical protein
MCVRWLYALSQTDAPTTGHLQSTQMQRNHTLIQGIVVHFLWRDEQPGLASGANSTSYAGASWLGAIVSRVVHRFYEGKDNPRALGSRSIQRSEQYHRDLSRDAPLIPSVEGGDLDQSGPQDISLLWGRYLGQSRYIAAVGVESDLWVALRIEVPARIARFSCIGGGHHITRPIPHVEEFDGAWLSALASGGGELEEPSGTVLIASVSATAGESMGEHGKIAHAHLLRSHSGILPSHGAVPENALAEEKYASQGGLIHRSFAQERG